MPRSGTYSVDWTSGEVQARSVVLAVPGVRHRVAAAPDGSDAGRVVRRRCPTRRRPRSPSGTGATRCLIRCEARDSSSREPRASRCWPARGSRRSGRAARPTVTSLMRGFLGGGRDPHRLDAPDHELIETAQQELTDASRHLGTAALHAALPLDAPEPAVRGGSPAACRADRAPSDGAARSLRHWQRLPGDRDPGLRQRCACHGSSRRGLSGVASIPSSCGARLSTPGSNSRAARLPRTFVAYEFARRGSSEVALEDRTLD